MSQRYYNTSIKNLEYRLRKFKDSLGSILEDVIRSKEDIIVSAVADDQLFRRGITGRGVKISSYAPYAQRTIEAKKKKGQPTTRVTLRDTGKFHKAMHIIYDSGGLRITSDDKKTPELVEKYGADIFRLTDKNLNRILHVHIRRELIKQLKQQLI